MSLASSQAAFMAQVLDEEASLPSAWGNTQSAGMGVYRNNYRSSVVEALRSTYERTARWVGKDAFRQAAAHHIIMHPPASWTLDAAGQGFDLTCAELFTDDPEVAELAWLEWTMLDIFTMRDQAPLDQAGFAAATADFAESDWGTMRLAFLPGTTQCKVRHDLLALWNKLSSDDFERVDAALEAAQSCVVWREGERPVFALVPVDEGTVLDAMIEGASYEEACAILARKASSDEEVQQAAMRAGAMLGRWLNDGLIAAVNPD
ncbi:HvfC/BufC N-terminal domain-containing protein [Altererythrobacter lutimaris]|uniref:Putative DNA-binding domain-containing protein n=1 Tax=Altererythrobacter lutimaris TaxID=2743979 RepID=A0A850HDU9_9SPHN|nr:DNA-binding domain-containing protein [Altererythrobacter lutimaris]NVE95830.1 putative DNA-binding domain-containing protein [Altererythrobacter lutimaris]